MTLTEDTEDSIIEDERDLIEEVARYNKYSSSKMTYQGVDGWYTLFIDDRQITNDDIYSIVERVQNINRELGLTHLGG